MTDKGKKKVLRAAKETRYGAFLSIGELLGVKAPGLVHALKVEFLPQWEHDGQTEAVLSKRSLLVDIRASHLRPADIEGLATMAERVRQAALGQPDTLLKIVQAFGRTGSKAERERALERAEQLGLWQRGDPEPPALWGIVLLAGAAVLIAGCCQETDTECDSDAETETDNDQRP
jgi:hypothetical protein